MINERSRGRTRIDRDRWRKGKKKKVGLGRWSTVPWVMDCLLTKIWCQFLKFPFLSLFSSEGYGRSIKRRARTGLVNGMWWILRTRDPLSGLDNAEKRKCHHFRMGTVKSNLTWGSVFFLFVLFSTLNFTTFKTTEIFKRQIKPLLSLWTVRVNDK